MSKNFQNTWLLIIASFFTGSALYNIAFFIGININPIFVPMNINDILISPMYWFPDIFAETLYSMVFVGAVGFFSLHSYDESIISKFKFLQSLATRQGKYTLSVQFLSMLIVVGCFVYLALGYKATTTLISFLGTHLSIIFTLQISNNLFVHKEQTKIKNKFLHPIIMFIFLSFLCIVAGARASVQKQRCCEVTLKNGSSNTYSCIRVFDKGILVEERKTNIISFIYADKLNQISDIKK